MGNTLFGALTIHLFSPTRFVSQILSGGQGHVGCPLKEWNAISLFSALGCAVARRGLEARGGFLFLTESLCLWKQTQEEILLPLAIVPLLFLKDVLSAEQQLKGLQEGAGIASCRSQEADEVPEPAPGGLSLHKFNAQLED